MRIMTLTRTVLSDLAQIDQQLPSFADTPV